MVVSYHAVQRYLERAQVTLYEGIEKDIINKVQKARSIPAKEVKERFSSKNFNKSTSYRVWFSETVGANLLAIVVNDTIVTILIERSAMWHRKKALIGIIQD